MPSPLGGIVWKLASTCIYLDNPETTLNYSNDPQLSVDKFKLQPHPTHGCVVLGIFVVTQNGPIRNIQLVKIFLFINL